MLFAAATPHRGANPAPVVQILLGAVSLMVTGVLVRSPEWRCSAGSAIWALCLVLCVHFDSLAHGVETTSDAGRLRLSHGFARDTRDLLATRLRKLAASLPDPLPSGWLEDQAAVRGDASLAELLRCTESHIEPCWHTWLTSLRRVRRVPVAAWTPGGPPAVAAERIEWRARDPR